MTVTTTYHPPNHSADPRVIAAMARARALNRWPAWTWTELPEGLPDARGWTREVRRVASNSLFAVLVRPLPDGADHAMITSPSGPPSWAEKQRIKDHLFGGRWAVECFPPRTRIVDGAEAYHLWVLPHGAAWPYDLCAKPGDPPAPDGEEAHNAHQDAIRAAVERDQAVARAEAAEAEANRARAAEQCRGRQRDAALAALRGAALRVDMLHRWMSATPGMQGVQQTVEAELARIRAVLAPHEPHQESRACPPSTP